MSSSGNLFQTVEYKQTQSEIYRTAITEFLKNLPEFVDALNPKTLRHL